MVDRQLLNPRLEGARRWPAFVSTAFTPHDVRCIAVIRISRRRARQIAVSAQLLDAVRPVSIVSAVKSLGFIQMDPTAVVARTEHLVLWSRLGNAFRPKDLALAVYRKRTLFEWAAFIYPAADYALYRPRMSEWPRGAGAWNARVRDWLSRNEQFRGYVLRELEKRGPLRSRDLEDRSVTSWPSSGWTNNRNVGQMLDFLGTRGEIAVAGRQGSERLWDVAHRVLPVDQPAIEAETATRALALRRLRSQGIGLRKHLGEVGVPVEVVGVAGDWVAEPHALEQPFAGRSAILSPFDRLVYDRERLLALFGFDYRLEMYVPRDKRRWGYYVLPILVGDRIVARVDAAADRKRSLLRVRSLLPEAGAKRGDTAQARAEIESLRQWLGLERVVYE